MNSDSSYRNPFTDYHANQIDVQSLLDYWCDPFSVFSAAGPSERDVYRENGPMVFIGGRGSGKTMFLRYFSHEVQRLRFEQESNGSSNFIDYLNERGGVGVYIRFDGAALKSFEGPNLTDDVWRNLFVQYFELFLAREFLFALKTIGEMEPSLEGSLPEVLKGIGSALGCNRELSDLDKMVSEVNDRLSELSNFRGTIGFQPDAVFRPTKSFVSQELSFAIPSLVRNSFPRLDPETKFLILIDEFENFSAPQQRILNTLIKFSTPNLTFRIGMRRNGWRTFATVNDDDFIKEGRDYEEFVFEEILHSKNSGYQGFLLEIARRRLERIPYYWEHQITDIKEFLGAKEDLEAEARQIVDDKPSKIDSFFKSKFPKISNVQLAPNESPLIRALGFLWIVRGESKADTQQAISDYEGGVNSELRKKLQYDLMNKYRLSLAIILASIYRKRKLYYSFNTYSYLSSGIVGNFIELCRYAFRNAEFNSDTAYVEAPIKKELQDKAARDTAMNELQQVKRIEQHGSCLYRLVENLGDIFRKYHLDLKIRYPETNQFSLDEGSLDDSSKAAFDAALMWSVIQKKPTLQRSDPGAKRTELYTLNRIFSPLFQTSYRTRGGISEAYQSSDFVKLITEDNVHPQRKLKIEESEPGSQQESLFPR